MKIYSTSPISIKQLKISKTNNRTNINFESNLTCDSFEKNTAISRTETNTETTIDKFNDFLNKKGRVSLEEYRRIKQENPEFIKMAQEELNNIYNSDMVLTPNALAKLAVTSKEMLDKRYKGKPYRILSIGTSPAILSNALNILGCEVIHIPISGVKNYHESIRKNLDIAVEYAISKGIDDKKINVLMDFMDTGRTIKTVQNNLIEKLPNIKTELEEIQFLLGDAIERAHYIKKTINADEKRKLSLGLRNEFFASKTGEVSNMPHMFLYDELNDSYSNCIKTRNKTTEEIYKQIEEFSTPEGRTYELCLFNELDKIKAI